MNQEQAICDFCKESKPVKRYYVRVKNKHFDDNKQGRYSNYFSYCKDCGIDYHAISEARADLKREMMEKMPKEVEITRLDRKTDNDQRLEGYNQAVSEIKQIWEQIN